MLWYSAPLLLRALVDDLATYNKHKNVIVSTDSKGVTLNTYMTKDKPRLEPVTKSTDSVVIVRISLEKTDL